MDAKQLAIILGVAILVPLFLGLFMDAVYETPKYEDYCNNTYSKPYMEPKIGTTCPAYDSFPDVQKCYNEKGNPIPKYDARNCQVFDRCDYCQRDFDKVNQIYNRNLFFILAPIGLVIVIFGIYMTIEYMGASLMFAGLLTMFYATVRYFTDMSKMLRALVILAELLVIMWIAYKKIKDTRLALAPLVKRKTRKK